MLSNGQKMEIHAVVGLMLQLRKPQTQRTYTHTCTYEHKHTLEN